jgi:hypothetical protein
MADPPPEPERIAEVLREIIALSQTGRRPNKPERESTRAIETAEGDKPKSTSSSEAGPSDDVCNRQSKI